MNDKKPMPEATANEEPRDFIRDMVQADLARGLVQGIVTRFPPEPNGYLHLGHAKSICLNFGLAVEYGGRCHLRFDDTNPVKEEQEYIDAIKRDVHWLGFDWGEHLYHASDYFQTLYDWAEHLIRAGLAYVDDTPPDEMRAMRGTLTEPGRASADRDRSVETNLSLFRDMRAGKFPNGACVLRAKIDLASGNMNLRDPVLYRILHAPHPRTGTQWCIYPTYDFAHGQSDAMEHVTHSLCTLEFEDHRPLYDWFLDHLPVPSRPRQTEFARLNLGYTVLSKRYLTDLVRRGIVSGWDDPRMPTLAGLRRRGVPPEAIRDFVRRIGMSKANSVVDLAMFDHAIRDRLNQAAQRRMAVLRPLKLVIENFPEDHVEELEAVNHPADPGAGTRTIRFGREIFIERDDFMENPPNKFFRLAVGREVQVALCLSRHLPTGGEGCGRQRGGAALHLRSGQPRRQCTGRSKGEGHPALGVGPGRTPRRGPFVQYALQPPRPGSRWRSGQRLESRLARSPVGRAAGTLVGGDARGRSRAIRAAGLFLPGLDEPPGRPGVQPHDRAARHLGKVAGRVTVRRRLFTRASWQNESWRARRR